MNKIFESATLNLTSLLLIDCSQNNGTAPLKESKLEQSTSTQSKSSTLVVNNTETNLDWAGKYKGTIHCADCAGTKTELELELKPDKTYELNEGFLGTRTKNESEVKGSFSFYAQNRFIITLDDKADQRKCFVGEKLVEAREIKTRNKIESKLGYKLIKEIK